MIPYILHVAAITTACLLFYKGLLQKQTFYRLNRWVLMGCLAVSFVLPLISVPREWSWRESYSSLAQDWAKLWQRDEASAVTPVNSNELDTAPLDQTAAAPLSDAAKATPVGLARQRKAMILQTGDKGGTASSAEKTVRSGEAGSGAAASSSDKDLAGARLDNALGGQSVNEGASQSDKAVGSQSDKSVTVSAAGPSLAQRILKWLSYCYLFGVLIFAVNFLFQMLILLYQSYAAPAIRDGRFRIVETSGNRAPCSFGNTIFINPANYDWETYNQILLHEKTHVSGRHTLDILFAEAALILQWFNPFIWLYRREIENNLEFLTDDAVLGHSEVDPSAYQLNLLRVSVPNLPFSLTNNYNQSLLKKRIVMMNSKRSSRHTVWKYFFLLPLLTGLVCALNKPAAVAQTAAAHITTDTRTAIAADAAIAARAAVSAKVDVKVAETINVKVDTTIREESDTPAPVAPVAPAASAAPAVAPVAPVPAPAAAATPVPAGAGGPMPSLSPMPVVTPMPALKSLHGMKGFRRPGEDELTDGSWFVTTEGDKLQFTLSKGNGTHHWQSNFSVNKNEVDPYPGAGTVNFKLTREAGYITFKGQFDGKQGYGNFVFTANESYVSALKQMGLDLEKEHLKGTYFMLDITKAYVHSIVESGFPHVSCRELITLSALKIDKEYIRYWKEEYTGSSFTLNQLVSLKALNVDKAYVGQLKAAGLGQLTAAQLTSLKAMNIDGAYISSVNKAEGRSLSVDDLITNKAMNIDDAYISSFKEVGYDHLSHDNLVTFHSLGITADFVKGWEKAGYQNISANDLITLKSLGVTPDFGRSFEQIGYRKLEPDQLVTLKSIGVTSSFVKEFSEIGYKDIPVDMLTSLKATGVDAAYVTRMKAKGLDSKDLNKYIELKSSFN